MKCPACNRPFVSLAWFNKHIADCKGPRPSRRRPSGPRPSALRPEGVIPSIPPPPRLLPTLSDWAWVSSLPVTVVVGRRLPRLYRRIPFAFREEMQRAFSLPLRRLCDDIQDVGAWAVFIMLPLWCLALPLRGGVAGHRVTRKRIARFMGGDWESLHREHVARCQSLSDRSSRTVDDTQGPASIRRVLHLGRCGELSRATRALVPMPFARGD